MSIYSETNEEKIEAPGKKIRTIRGVIIGAKQETKDTWTLYLFVSDQDKDYKAGQFLNIGPHQFKEIYDLVKFFEYEKGKQEPVRAYSITSAPYEKYVAITIKPEIYEPYPGSFPPLLSPLLASDLLVGREIEFTGYAGAYIIPKNMPNEIETIVHLVAGSGVVPNYSIIKDELVNQKNTHIKHIMINVNKSFNDIIFHQDLLNLERRFPERISIRYFLSQESLHAITGEHYYHGRPSIEHVQYLVNDPKKALFFACGPAVTKWQKRQAQETSVLPKPRFMEWVNDVIIKLNVDKKHFKKEIYG